MKAPFVRGRVVLVLIGACFSLMGVLAPPSHAQALQGSIVGNVTDPNGALIPGAAVNATDTGTNYTRDTTTNESGSYTFTLMPPGTYTVKVTAAGFQTYSKTGVTLQAEAVVRVDAALTIGQVSQTVEVTGESEVMSLQTDTADVHSDLNAPVLEALPLPMGRNYEQSFTTLPGMTPPQSANSFGANPTRSLTMGANGLSGAYSTVTKVDGTFSENPTTNGESGYTPAIDAIESVNVILNSPDAEVGGSGGAAINVVMKSGTNNFHGSAFEDHSDNHMKAYPWSANTSQPEPRYISNSFGATVGGPIKKDNLFYFLIVG